LGIQTFVVPIRDPKTLLTLEGVDAGDIGPKLGFFRADNGYLGLKNVRIPRNNMLMRYT
jgi:acyl-CoA oxidase